MSARRSISVQATFHQPNCATISSLLLLLLLALVLLAVFFIANDTALPLAPRNIFFFRNFGGFSIVSCAFNGWFSGRAADNWLLFKIQSGEEAQSLLVLVDYLARAASLTFDGGSDHEQWTACLVYQRLIVFMLPPAAY